MWSHGSFYWNELMTRNTEAAKKFYGAALGWTFDGMPIANGTYWIAKCGGESVGGIVAAIGPEFAKVVDRWFSYVAVDDIDKRVKMAAAAGGKVLREPFDVPSVGRIAFIEDPTGAPLGWMTPVQSP